jgi:hypothetical protein
MMEAARTSETSVDIQLRTRQYIPEDSGLHTRRRENLKSHKLKTSMHKLLKMAPETSKSSGVNNTWVGGINDTKDSSRCLHK